MKPFINITLSLLILSSFSTLKAQQITISTDSETYSLEKGLEELYTHPQKYKGDVTIELGKGNYFVPKPIEIKDKLPCKSLTIKAKKDEKVTLHGGVKIKNWKKHEGQIYVAEVNGAPFRQLYVNGKRAIRSRTPNKGDHYLVEDWDLKERTILAEKLPFALETTEENPTEIIILMSWAEAILRIDQSKNTDKHTVITPVAYEQDLVFKRMWPKKWKNLHCIFENSYSYIDQDFEWYLDRKNKKVYIQFPKGHDPNQSDIIAPQSTELLKVSGGKKPLKNIRIEGIDFQYSNWTRAFSYGMLDIQSGQYNIPPTLDNKQYIGRPIAALSFNHVTQAQVVNCHFSNLGSAAIDIHK